MHDRQSLVAREAELDRLDGFLDEALAGRGGLCFVTGEAGAGKTALVDAFTLRAQTRSASVVFARGTCDAQTGVGDAYLPFREVLGQLVGGVDATLARGAVSNENGRRLEKLLALGGETLVELGPDLIGLLVPGAALAASAGRFLFDRAGWLERLRERTGKPPPAEAGDLDQSQIFEQYVNVLRGLAARAPLVLVLDDLQWADAASLGLLFRLGRRLEGSRLLVVGLYRPADVALGRGGERHPLEPLASEMKRYFGDIEIDLDAVRGARGRAFVDAYLDLEANRLGEEFRAALHRHTGGHPLFTVELLRALQERGDLVRRDGAWIEGAVLDWHELPSRIEGVMEERVGRLTDDLRESLDVASVEGEQFTAEVVAAVRSAEARELVRQLGGTLQKRHRLVESHGAERLGERRLSRYRFSYSMMQSYLYGQIDEVEASFLHEDVGTALEELYGADSAAVAVQLARHFDLAGRSEKARHYLKEAGEQAALRYANDEAVAYFGRALELTPPDDDEARFELLLARVEVLDLQGARPAQARDLEALTALGAALADPARRAEVALRRAGYAVETGDYPAARTAAHEATELARDIGDLAREAAGEAVLGRVLYLQAHYAEAREHLERGLARAREAGQPATEAACTRHLGIVADLAGEAEAARARFEQALAIYRRVGSPSHEARALANVAVSAWRQGRNAEARDYLEQGLRMSRGVGDRAGEGRALANLAMVGVSQGDFAGARAYAEQALRLNRDIGSPYSLARTLGIVGSIALSQGDYPAARRAFDEALHIDREVGDRQDEAFRLSHLGYVAVQFGAHAEARERYAAALEVSREIGDRSIEAAALRGLGLLSSETGDDEAARDYCLRALRISREIDHPEGQGEAWTYLGRAQAALGDLEGARYSYERARELPVEGGDALGQVAAQEGLARVALARGDTAGAAAHLAGTLEEALTGDLDGVHDRFGVFLTCYRLLSLQGDPRAVPLLERACALLRSQGARIGDEVLRRSFLDNVPHHRELLATWRAVPGGSPP